MKKLGIVTATAVAALMAGSTFAAENLPSSKAAFKFSELVALGVACAADGVQSGDINSGTCPGGSTDDTGFVTILETQIKTANKSDLAFDVSLQCGIVTDTTIKSQNGGKESSSARGTVSVLVEVTDESSGSVSQAEPNNSVDAFLAAAPGLVMCDRYQLLEGKFSGLNCTADLTTGAVTCADPEELRLLLRSLNAAAFNFLAADVEPGVKTVRVKARAQAAADVISTDSNLSNANGQAFAGAGSVMVEEVRLIKDAPIAQ